MTAPVHFRGIVLGPSGFAAEGREWLAAIEAAGLEPSLEGALLGPRDCELPTEQRELIDRCAARPRRPGGVTFHHMLVAHFAPDPMAESDLLCTLFETDSLPDGWAESIDRADRVLCRTDWNAETFTRAGVDPRRITVLPPPFDARDFVPATREPNAPFRWLSVFDWTLRKGHDLLFEAFGRTFTHGEAELLVKTHDVGRDLQAEAAAAVTAAATAAGHAPPQVTIRTDCVADVTDLYRAADGFVLPSRGEGWGRPVHEAMLMELPVVATQAASLQTMLVDESVGYPLSARSVPVSAAAAAETPCFADQQWYEVDIDAIGARMREVMRDPAEATTRAKRGRQHMLRVCDVERIAARLHEIVTELCATPTG